MIQLHKNDDGSVKINTEMEIDPFRCFAYNREKITVSFHSGIEASFKCELRDLSDYLSKNNRYLSYSDFLSEILNLIPHAKRVVEQDEWDDYYVSSVFCIDNFTILKCFNFLKLALSSKSEIGRNLKKLYKERKLVLIPSFMQSLKEMKSLVEPAQGKTFITYFGKIVKNATKDSCGKVNTTGQKTIFAVIEKEANNCCYYYVKELKYNIEYGSTGRLFVKRHDVGINILRYALFYDRRDAYYVCKKLIEYNMMILQRQIDALELAKTTVSNLLEDVDLSEMNLPALNLNKIRFFANDIHNTIPF